MGFYTFYKIILPKLTKAVIIALSALFQQDVGYITDVVNLDRTLELRQTPHIRQVNTYYPPNFNTSDVDTDRPYVGDIIEGLFTNLTTNWMYTAEIQLTMKGPEPSWSKDGWSFVPVDLTQLGDAKAVEDNTRLGQNLGNAQSSAINVTLTTPAIRARVECTRNDDIDDINTWGTTSGEKVKRGAAPPGLNLPIHNGTGHTVLSNLMFPSNVNYTPLTPDGKYITCCTNQTEPSRVEDYTAPITIGYWTSYFRNTSQHIDSPTGTNGNFSVKCKSVYVFVALHIGLIPMTLVLPDITKRRTPANFFKQKGFMDKAAVPGLRCDKCSSSPKSHKFKL